MSNEIVIRCAKDIRDLAASLSIWRSVRRPLEVAIPQLGEELNRQLHSNIAPHYMPCGCQQGRQTGIAIMAIYLLLLVSGWLSWQGLGVWRAIGLYFVLSFCGLLLTKLVVLERSRQALRRIADELDEKPAGIGKEMRHV
jgi:hypothetical protein